jgi:hypothetical protein
LHLLKVDEVVNAIRGLGEEVKEPLVVQKVLRSLLLRYDVKVSALVEKLGNDKNSARVLKTSPRKKSVNKLEKLSKH